MKLLEENTGENLDKIEYGVDFLATIPKEGQMKELISGYH